MSEEPRELFDAYLDGEMPDEDAAAFKSALERDPALREELNTYLRSVELVRELPVAQPPNRFLLMVQNRIRRRTRGRYFRYEPNTSLVVEAAVCAVLIFIMAGLYLIGTTAYHPPMDHDIASVERVRLNPGDRHVLEGHASIELVSTSVVGTDLEVSIVAPAGREQTIREALSAHPRLSLISTSVYRRDGKVWMRIRAPAGARAGPLH